MLARIRKSMDEKDQGFTLIELLVVMIIIGILAAIAIPVFLSQRQKARDTAAKADVSTLGKEIATYFVDNASMGATATLTITTAAANGVAAGHYDFFNGTTHVDLGRASSGIQIVKSTANAGTAVANGTGYAINTMTSTGWCIGVADNSTGTLSTVYKYSAQNGLESGKCTSDTAP